MPKQSKQYAKRGEECPKNCGTDERFHYVYGCPLDRSTRIDRTGCSRIVIVTKNLAFKIPAFYDSANHWSWRTFCEGMLANMQEVTFSRTEWPELCPVKFFIPLGLLVVMPRVRIMTDEEFSVWDVQAFIDKPDYVVPAETKANSFGWLGDKIVCIDYGN